MRLAQRSLRLLSKRRATSSASGESLGLESVSPQSLGGAESRGPAGLADHDLDDSLKRLFERLARVSGGAGRIDEAGQRLLADASRAIGALKADGPDATFDAAQALATEAVAVSDGSRPALRWRDNTLLPDDEQDLGMWRADFPRWAPALQDLCPSVGRVDVMGQQLGTAWLIRSGYVVTNRHVAQSLSIDPGEARLRFASYRPARITFADIGGGAGGSFQVERIVFAGPDWIDRRQVDHRKLDLAVLKIGPVDNAKEPRPLAQAPAEPPGEGADAVLALGFPGTTADSRLNSSTLIKLFENEMGVKRVSPGFVDRPIGTINGDTVGRVFGHDCTTLPGSSGSLLLTIDADGQGLVVGLHYSGFEETRTLRGAVQKGANFAHAFAAMSDVAALVDRAIAEDRGTPIARPATPATVQPRPFPAPAPTAVETTAPAPTLVTAAVRTALPVLEGLDPKALTSGTFDLDKALFFALASNAAYYSAEAKAWAQSSGFETFEAFDASNVQGFFCANANVALLAFRGTSNPGQWLRDFDTLPAPHPWGSVHAGFRDGVADVEPALKSFASLAATRRIAWITGHSLGGALALIAAARMKMASNLSPYVYTYGQPRVGLADFAERYALELPERTWRFVNQADIVTRVPPDPIFRHTGAVKRIVSPTVLESIARAEAAGPRILAEAAGPRIFADAVRESGLSAPRITDTEPPSLSSLEFAELKLLLGAGQAAGPQPPAAEGLFSPITDHYIAGYIGLLQSIRSAALLAT